jgi:DmsE family decaheme c-type cytochrome
MKTIPRSFRMNREWLMRTLKVLLVAAFLCAPLSTAISSKVTGLMARFSANSSAVEAAANTQSKKSQPVDASQFVGSESCAECHGAEATHYALTAHAKTKVLNAPVDKHGCEACHGPARGHVDFYLGIQKLNEAGKEAEATTLMNDTAKAAAAKLSNFKEMSAAQSTAICLKCHEGSQGISEERFNFRRSEHSRHGVSCNDCHSSHEPKRTEFLLKDSEPNMCYQCHAEQKSTFAKPFHHKVPEGGMKCSDCHNQHGGFMGKSLRNSVNGDMTCIKCHADKQGPFVFEHAPIKVEGCQACHTPHGSTNPKLLTRNNVKFLCLECHSNTPGIIDPTGTGVGPGTPSFHDITNPRYANCTVCHFEIHGSNKDPFFR